MPNYLVSTPASARDSGGKNILLIYAASASAARTRAEVMLGQVEGACADYDVTALPADTTGDCVIESGGAPIGTREANNIWSRKLSRGGNPLAL